MRRGLQWVRERENNEEEGPAVGQERENNNEEGPSVGQGRENNNEEEGPAVGQGRENNEETLIQIVVTTILSYLY